MSFISALKVNTVREALALRLIVEQVNIDLLKEALQLPTASAVQKGDIAGLR